MNSIGTWNFYLTFELIERFFLFAFYKNLCWIHDQILTNFHISRIRNTTIVWTWCLLKVKIISKKFQIPWIMLYPFCQVEKAEAVSSCVRVPYGEENDNRRHKGPIGPLKSSFICFKHLNREVKSARRLFYSVESSPLVSEIKIGDLLNFHSTCVIFWYVQTRTCSFSYLFHN